MLSTNGASEETSARLPTRILHRSIAGVLLLAATMPVTACINTESETLYEDVEITRKDEISADTVQAE